MMGLLHTRRTRSVVLRVSESNRIMTFTIQTENRFRYRSFTEVTDFLKGKY